MSSWSKRRKNTYLLVIAVLLVGAVGVPAFVYFYDAPTCFDGMMNGNERGIDCGGSCERLCSSSFLPASVAWTRFEEVAPKLYNIAAYVVNPNTDGEAKNVPYHIALYDRDGLLIMDFPGSMTLPPHRNTLAFKGAVSTGERIPAKVFFEFTGIPDWRKQSDTLASLQVLDKKYSETENSASLLVGLRNSGLIPIGRIAVYVVLYDKDGNSIGFSKTVVDGIAPRSNVLAPFTWPVNRNGRVISIEVLPVAE